MGGALAKKGTGGRPKGTTDKSRDYPKAVASMRALIAAGASDREACRIVGDELNIPANTLRNHLQGRTGHKPRLFLEFDPPLETLTLAEAEEIRRRGDEIRREREAEKAKRQARDEARQKTQRLIDSLRQAERYAIPRPRRPKKP